MKHAPLVPALYGALMKISLLRDEVNGFGGDLADAQAARYMARIQELEAKALRLLDHAEERRGVVQH
jgi:hypothetical protein